MPKLSKTESFSKALAFKKTILVDYYPLKKKIHTQILHQFFEMMLPKYVSQEIKI